jgi:hypothetical protein
MRCQTDSCISEADDDEGSEPELIRKDASDSTGVVDDALGR